MHRFHLRSPLDFIKNQIFLCGCLLSLLHLFGCRSETAFQSPAPNTPILPTLALVTETPHQMSTITHTVTVTPEPTIMPSKTPTQRIIWTPIATLPLEIRRQNLIDLFSSNGGCDFPCWWGIRQGDPIRKVSELSSTIGESLGSDNLSYNYTLSLDKFNFADLDVKFYVDDNQVVERMEVFLGQPSRFREYHAVLEERLSLSSILSRYGKPNEVLFLAAPLSEPASSRPYAVFVIYNEPGFGIVYSGNTDLDDPLRVCSIQINDHRVEDIALYLQEPRNDIQKLNRYFLNDFQPLEKVTSMSLDDFYRAFTTPGSDECIESPVDLWQ